MKYFKFLLFILFITNSYFSYAQGSLKLFISPDKPSTKDSIRIITHGYVYSWPVWEKIKSMKIEKDTIFLDLNYKTGFLQPVEEVIDTFYIEKLNAGDYTIKFKFKNGSHIDSIYKKLIVSYPASLNDFSNMDFFNVYPNPSTNTLYFENIKVNRVKILSITGQVVIDKQNMGSENQIDISSLKSGIYIIEVIDLSGKISRVKVVKN